MHSSESNFCARLIKQFAVQYRRKHKQFRDKTLKAQYYTAVRGYKWGKFPNILVALWSERG